jgi:hypothetical protein
MPNRHPLSSVDLLATGVTAATYGSATQSAQVTVNAQGQVTSASNVTISGVAPAGSAGGDLGGTYPNPTVQQLQGNALTKAANVAVQCDDTGATWTTVVPISSFLKTQLLLAAGVDVAGFDLFVAPCKMRVQSVYLISGGTASGIDNANTSVWAITKTGGATVASKTFNATTTFPANNTSTSLTLGASADCVLTAGQELFLAVTNGTTAATPSTQVQINWSAIA